MAYDYEDESPYSQTPARQPVDFLSLSYKMALAIWIVPAILAGMLMAAINVPSHDAFLSINPEDGEDFLRTEWRSARGWPCVLASEDPATRRWTLHGFGIFIDVTVVIAAMAITGGSTRFLAAFVDYEVNRPIQKQVRRLLRGNPKPAPKRSGSSGRASSSGGPPRVRRPRRPTDD